MKKERTFSVVIEHDKSGYVAMCPELQGCYSQGKTYEEAIKNIKDAIRLHVLDMLSEGDSLPESDLVSFSKVEVTV